MADIILAIMRQERNQERSQAQQPEGPGGPGGPAGDPNQNNGVGNPPVVKEWNADEIGFFDPDYEGEGPVVNAGKHVFYKDIYVFVDRCKDMALLRGDDKLRTVLPQCLRGAALIWHSAELSEMEKILLRGTNLTGWYDAMIHRFKERTPVALANLQKAKYSMSDAKNRKDPRSFIQDIIRHSKAANLTSVHNQLIMAWNNLDWEFRLHIPEPTATTTVRKFLEELDGQADMWFEMARHRGSYGPSNIASKKTSKFDKRPERPGTGASNEGRAANEAITNFMNMFMNQANQRRPFNNSNQNRTYSNSYQNRSSGNIEGKKPLQITSGSNESDSKKKDRSDRPKDRSRGYDKGKKAYVVDEDQEEEDTLGYYNKDEDEEVDYFDPDAYEEDVTSEGEPAANMAVTTSSRKLSKDNSEISSPEASFHCRSCGNAFKSNNQLHKHLRAGCSSYAFQVSETSSSKALVKVGPVLRSHTKSLNTPKPLISSPKNSIPVSKSPKDSTPVTTSTPIAASSKDSIPVVKSSVDPNASLGTGYGFRGFQYATTTYSIGEDGDHGSGCLDSGCGISLHDIDYFHKVTKGQVPIRTMATPVTVRGIGTNRHKTDKYAIVDLRFQGLKDGKPAIASFQRELHLVSDLQANLLIGTDILNPEKFKVDFEKDEACIGSCGVTIPVFVKTRAVPVNKSIHLKKTTIIPPHSIVPVPIHNLATELPSDRDFMFEPNEVSFSLYAHMVNSETKAVLVRNDEDRAIRIPRNLRLGHLTEMEYPNAYYAGEVFSSETKDETSDQDLPDLARRRPKSEHKKSWFKKVLAACDVLFTASLIEISQNFHRKIVEGYKSDPAWTKISSIIDNGTEDGARIFFSRENDLIYL